MVFCVVDVTAAVRFRIVQKKGVGRQHTTFTSCQNAACSKNVFFSPTGRLCSKGNVLTDQM